MRGFVGWFVVVTAVLAVGAEGQAGPEERRALDRTIKLIREAQSAVQYPGSEPQVDELLGGARDRLSRLDGDHDIRRAADHVARAITVLRENWRSPQEKSRRVREEGDRAVGLIRGSRLYAAQSPPAIAPAGRLGIGEYRKKSFESERFSVPIGQFTADRAFSRVIVAATAGERGFTPIVATILVRVRGQWVEHPVRARLAPGETAFPVEIPRGATDLLFSLDHGKDGTIRAFIE